MGSVEIFVWLKICNVGQLHHSNARTDLFARFCKSNFHLKILRDELFSSSLNNDNLYTQIYFVWPNLGTVASGFRIYELVYKIVWTLEDINGGNNSHCLFENIRLQILCFVFNYMYIFG